MTPALTGSLEGLKHLDVDDLESFRAAVEAGRQTGWKYYFPYLLSLTRPGLRAPLYVREGGSACVFLWQLKESRPRLDLYLAPAPMDAAALRRCIERANDFNDDYSARVMRIDEKDKDTVAATGIEVRPRKRQYIYATRLYGTLSGKRLYTVRRNVQLVERLSGGVEIRPYSSSHADECHTLLTQWRKAHRTSHGTLGGVGTSRRAIDLAARLPEDVLRGELIYIDGRLAAFSFGGAIRPGLAAFFERKCDGDIRGLSYYQLRSFLLGLQAFDRVNDGSDAGRPGLRQLKDSFRPVDMHVEYRGNQLRRGARTARPAQLARLT